jgi:hypothetical protein
MPRIIEPLIGKVVGPLRMKVPPPLAMSNAVIDHSCNRRSKTTLNRTDRRGRYSRNRGNMKKLRSKSLPQSSCSSIHLGKPPESDEPLHGEPEASNTSKQNSMGAFGISDGTGIDEGFSNIAGFKHMSILPTKRHALAIDTRCLVPKKNEIEKVHCWESAFIRHCKYFLRTLDCRDAAPCILAVSRAIGRGSISRGNPAVVALGIETEAFNLVKGLDRTVVDKAIDASDRSIISGFPVQTTEAKGGAIRIPLACRAKISWLLFSSLGTSQFLPILLFQVFNNSSQHVSTYSGRNHCRRQLVFWVCLIQ